MLEFTRQMTLWGPRSRFGLLVAGLTLLLDQANKWWLLEIYDIAARGRVAVTPFLDLVFVKNTGVSYGLLASEGMLGQYLLALFAGIVAVVLFVWLARVAQYTLALAIALVLGGALSNAIDRLLLGGVADFYSLHAFGFYWYVFNLADVAIVAGAALFLYEYLCSGRKRASNEA